MPAGESVTLGSLVRALEGRSHALLILVLVVPFLQPIPLPGISTIFGLAIAAIGMQMALGRPPWLPARLREQRISRELLGRIGRIGRALFQRFERFIKPRGRFFHAHPGMRRTTGAAILGAGLLLSLPLPIPVSNFLPALSIALLSLGSLEEDGLVVVLGFVAFAVACAFFVGLVLLPVLGIDSLRAIAQP